MKRFFSNRFSKRLIYFVLCTIVLCQMAYPVKAESVAEKNSMEVEFLPDGSYFLTTLEDIVPTRHVTAASISRQIQKKKTSSCSGNTATAKAVVKHYENGVIIGITSREVSLSCSPSGIFS